VGKTGFTQQKILTNLYWENPTISKAKLVKKDSMHYLSQVELYMSDGLHPRTKEVLNLVADIITPWLAQVR
jgi:hypothetical protein